MKAGCILFDWGDTLMVDYPELKGPMALWPRVSAVAGAQEALETLRARGWLIALATNAADSDETEIRAALDRVGLDGLVDRVYCSRNVGQSKPSRRFFAFIESDLGLDASELVMVGDNYEVDVIGAERAGIRVVWLNHDGVPMPDSGMRRSLRELQGLPDLLVSWQSDEVARPT